MRPKGTLHNLYLNSGHLGVNHQFVVINTGSLVILPKISQLPPWNFNELMPQMAHIFEAGATIFQTPSFWVYPFCQFFGGASKKRKKTRTLHRKSTQGARRPAVPLVRPLPNRNAPFAATSPRGRQQFLPHR